MAPRNQGKVEISTETIRLDQFLKLAGIVESGGEAKARIQRGEIVINGTVELRRGRKLQPGDRVSWGQGEARVGSPGGGNSRE